MRQSREPLGAVLLGVLLAGCELLFGSPMLEVRVSNESDADATVTISQSVSGIGDEIFATRVDAGTVETIVVEYPGPEAWTLLVDEVPITDSSQWPSDNPTVDLSIVIRSDASVEVVDD